MCGKAICGALSSSTRHKYLLGCMILSWTRSASSQGNHIDDSSSSSHSPSAEMVVTHRWNPCDCRPRHILIRRAHHRSPRDPTHRQQCLESRLRHGSFHADTSLPHSENGRESKKQLRPPPRSFPSCSASLLSWLAPALRALVLWGMVGQGALQCMIVCPSAFVAQPTRCAFNPRNFRPSRRALSSPASSCFAARNRCRLRERASHQCPEYRRSYGKCTW